MNVRVKICGIRKPETARVACAAGADAIGLVFADGSPRHVDFDDAAHIAAAVGPFVDIVGLFVDHTVKQIRSIARDLTLTTIQLHGEYDAADIDKLAPHRVIRAVHFHAEGAGEMLRYWEEIHQELPNLSGILLDTPGGRQRGGTGESFDWFALRKAMDEAKPTVPIVLAGGLTVDNVAEAVRVVGPWAVDVSSGVESKRGVKDAAKIRAFCAAAKGKH